MAIEQPRQGQLLGQSWTLVSPREYSLEQESQSAQVGKEVHRQPVVASKRKLNTYSQHPKCLVAVLLRQANTLPSFYDCAGTHRIAIGVTSKAGPLRTAPQATSAPFVGTKRSYSLCA